MTFKDRALNMGFSDVAEFSPRLITCSEELRALCKSCKAYGSCWMCPPHCPPIDEMQKNIDTYSNAILLTSRSKADPFDEKLTLKLGHKHSVKLFELARKMPHSFVLTAGNCQLCEKCACPDMPCRHSELNFGSISAHGIDIIKLCNEIGVNIEFKTDEVSFIGIIIW